MRWLLLLLAPIFLVPLVLGDTPPVPQEGPIIVVYSGSMTEWGNALCEVINADPGIEASCLNVEDKDLLSLILFLPRTRCLVLAPMTSGDVNGLAPMINDFFEQGGAVIGFSPCTDHRSEPEMASLIFPFYCNKSGNPERIGKSSVNTYLSRDLNQDINEGVPETFRLISSGFLYCSDRSGEYIEVLPEAGCREVFYEHNLTGAPLVIGYSKEGSGRSMGFSGCRINSIPRSNTYFGHLVDQKEFSTLFQNCITWAIKGSPRFAEQDNTWQDRLEEEKNRRSDAFLRGEEMEKRSKMTRNLALMVVWIVAVAVSTLVLFKLVLGK